jgi:CTP-dependent riboflavin kinase
MPVQDGDSIGERRPKRLTGAVIPGFGLATKDGSDHLQRLSDVMGIGPLHAGALNLQIEMPYDPEPDAVLLPNQWNGTDHAVLKRCRVRGLRCVLYKPYLHQPRPGWKHNPLDVLEIMSARHLRTEFNPSHGSPLVVEVEGDEAWWFAPERDVSI